MPPEILDGGTFTFLDPGYEPKIWQGEHYIFPRISPNIHQVYVDKDYIYTANNFGVDIFDIASELVYATIKTASGYITIAGDDDYIYLGTTGSGTKKLLKTNISGSVVSPYNLSAYVTNYLTFPYIESNNINYISVAGHYTGLILASGTKVASIKDEPQGYYSSTTMPPGNTATKCHITSDGYIYYIVTTSGESMVSKAKGSSNWTPPLKSYVTGGGVLASGIVPRDIYVTEGTASDGTSNTLFIATTSGAYIVDESSEKFAVYYTS